jgi:hypothetical protein
VAQELITLAQQEQTALTQFLAQLPLLVVAVAVVVNRQWQVA